MKNYIVTCLTYKRKYPKIFDMLFKDPELVIHFGVRREEYENGFYDNWKDNSQIKFILLDNVVDAGDTRQKILDACHEMKYKYVVQFDDTVRNIRHMRKTYTATKCIETAIEEIENSELNPIGFEFVRAGTTERKTHKAYIQAWIINIERLFETGIRFKCVKDVGWDDFVFSWEVHNTGFYTITDPDLVRVAKSTYPWANEAGGTHVGESFDVKSMIEKNNARCQKAKQYLEDTFNAKNVSIRKLTSGKRTFDYVHAEW